MIESLPGTLLHLSELGNRVGGLQMGGCEILTMNHLPTLAATKESSR
jgi:hypothetical protein